VKIWDYVDPDKAENKIKENTKPEIPLIAAAPAAPVALIVTPVAPVTAPATPAAAFTTPATAPTASAATLISTGTVTPALLN